MAGSAIQFPKAEGLYYGGAWHSPIEQGTAMVESPATGEVLAKIAYASVADIDPAVAAAVAGQIEWRDVLPSERAKILREIAAIIRKNAEELALLDAVDCGNPVAELRRDIELSAEAMDFHAGLVTEMKGASVPMGPDSLSFSVREPYGVVARIAPFNHPFIFGVGRAAAPLAAGNSVVVKPPEQAPLSALRAAELIGHLLPAGAYNVVPGDRDVGAALVAHGDVALVAVTGSVPTGKAVMRAASGSLKRVILELGGKNALMALPDADPEKVAAAVVRGMNFTWCGQSCGSTSRAFIHDDIYDQVLELLPKYAANYRPGLPTDPQTTMGSLVNKAQLERVLGYIESAKAEGARLIFGGSRPEDPELANGCFLYPTIFADVTMDMRIAREEIFGPVLSVLRWSDEEEALRQINNIEYGLTFAVFTENLVKAHRIIGRAQSGFCWINEVSRHAVGSPFGGFKQSGIGREECLEELLSYTQEKNVFINLAGK
ncbi:aldehyde dehydrogenase [Sphingobium sp. SCG-1]|uniref:aldehyde dehydrogenase family protein n=1 Tax=Sphingobium sp. SCG-1 TaxID=2072936 RepID=UPI000CD6835D|nr:aldehyde dehydrogenase family protein [Sphingobium sp. SCG-1]AUW57179.1 aldehyde dehydrogenase [Sphingobium sp. SCG-1]